MKLQPILLNGIRGPSVKPFEIRACGYFGQQKGGLWPVFVFDLREVSPMSQWIINQEACKPVLDKFTPKQQELIEKMAAEIAQELEAEHG